jgi:hypothetical protein
VAARPSLSTLRRGLKSTSGRQEIGGFTIKKGERGVGALDREFSPAKVRERLVAAGAEHVMPAGDDWYREFCELYSHATPDTRPNVHNDLSLPIVGGIWQPTGVKKVMEELSTVLGSIALLLARSDKMDDHERSIERLLQKV